MICQHCKGAGWVKSVREGFIVDRCGPCRGNGAPDAPAPPPRRLGLRERITYAVVNWLCARKVA